MNGKRVWNRILLALGVLMYAVLFCVALLHAEPLRSNAGVGYYFLSHKTWPCKKSLQAFNGVTYHNLSVLWPSPSESLACLSEFVSGPGLKSIQIHLSNGSCLRLGSCGVYEGFAGRNVQQVSRDIEKGVSPLPDLLSRRLLKAKLQFPNVEILVSPMLEHGLSCPVFRKLSAVLKEICPACLIVNNPYPDHNMHELCGADVFEAHTTEVLPRPPKGARLIINLDGEDIPPDNVHGFLLNFHTAYKVYYWQSAYNCRQRGVRPPDIRKRRCGFDLAQGKVNKALRMYESGKPRRDTKFTMYGKNYASQIRQSTISPTS